LRKRKIVFGTNSRQLQC